MQDPVTLFDKSGKSKQVPAIDAPAWIKHGWNTGRQFKQQKAEAAQLDSEQTNKTASEKQPNTDEDNSSSETVSENPPTSPKPKSKKPE